MKRTWDKKTAGLAAAALMLTAGMTVGRAMAYFTTCVTVSGGYELHLEGFTTTTPQESVSNWEKNITILNEGPNDCYVRVKVFAGEQYDLTYTIGGWSALGNDGYYYWPGILQPKESENSSTGPLAVQIGHENAKDDFNVIVVQECTPVPYENGVPVTWDKVDWTRTADVTRTVDGEE